MDDRPSDDGRRARDADPGAGCSRTDNEPGPGGVTVSEAKALDDAAEMLESRDSAPVAAAVKPDGDAEKTVK